MTVAKGMKVNLFASEKEFPELVNPVQMAFDTKGRLWVAVWPTYPHWKPKEQMNDKLLILEDTNGDGKADKCMTVFADDLHSPTGFEFWNGGVLVAQAPGPAVPQGHRRRRQGRRARARAARPRLGRHASHGQQLRARSGRGALLPGRHVPPHAGRDALRPAAAAAPTPASSATSRGRRSSRSTSPTASPTRTATSSTAGARTSSSTAPARNPYHAALFSGHVDFPHKHAAPPQVYQQRTRPCPGIEILSSRHFPDEMQGNLLVANVIGFQGILQYKIERQGRELRRHARSEPILSSTDPNFRPSDVEDRARTARSTSPTGTTRSSATCSTTSAIRAATASTAASTASRYEGRPLLKPREDRRRADREAARPAEGARRTASATGRGSSWAAATTDEVDRRGAEVDRRASTRRTPTTSTTCWKALWVHQKHNVVERRAC